MGRSFNRNNEDLVDQEKSLGESPSSENLLARECKTVFTIPQVLFSFSSSFEEFIRTKESMVGKKYFFLNTDLAFCMTVCLYNENLGLEVLVGPLRTAAQCALAIELGTRQFYSFATTTRRQCNRASETRQN